LEDEAFEARLLKLLSSSSATTPSPTSASSAAYSAYELGPKRARVGEFVAERVRQEHLVKKLECVEMMGEVWKVGKQ
jgi:hypothetical protein